MGKLKRGRFVVIGTLMLLFLGTIYAWSYFKTAIGAVFPMWDQKMLSLTFTIMMICFALGGLLGGHSGEMIGKGRANADRLLARLLYRLDKEAKYYLSSFNGGKKDNAIPREAKAEILFAGNVSKKDIRETVRTFANDIAKEYSVTDPDIEITTRWMDKDGEKEDKYIVFRRKDTRRMVRFLMALPNGVIRFSPLFKDIPRTSLNLGIVKRKLLFLDLFLTVVGGKGENFARVAVKYALKLLTRAYRPVNGIGVDAEDVFDILEQIKGALSVAIHFIDQGDYRYVAHDADLEQLDSLLLNAL